MKAKYALIALLAITFWGCDDNTAGLGLGMFPGSDQNINGKLSTFDVTTESVHAGKIYAMTNVGYVGKFTDETFGTYQAGFLAELNCPSGMTFPGVYDGTALDEEKKATRVMVGDDNEDNKEIRTDIENLFKDVIGDRINNYSVESLKSEDTPAIILISEQSRRMAEMRSQFAGMDFGMSFEEEKTLVINNNSSIVKKLVSLKDDESKKEQISLICNQIVDIALLSNKELDEFIKRNNQLMSMVISL